MDLFHRFRRKATQLCCCNRLDFAFGGERRDLVEDSPVGFGGVVVRQPAENHFRVQRYRFRHKRVHIEAGRAVAVKSTRASRGPRKRSLA